MADESRNPQDQYSFRQLLAQLKATNAEIEGLDRGIAELRKEAQVESRRAATRESGTARQTRARARAAVPATADEAKRIADETERAARAEQRRTEAARRRSELVLPERRSARETITAEQRAAEKLAQTRVRDAQRRIALERRYLNLVGTRGALDPRLLLVEPERRSTIDDLELARRVEERRQQALREQARVAYERGRLPLGAGAPPAPPPPRPPAPPAPPPPPPDDGRGLREVIGGSQRERVTDTEALTAAQQRAQAQQEALDHATRVAAQGTQEQRRALQEHARTLGLSGDSFRRHGALTTEFITAAAKGQTTIRELGYQVGATIGKFAGWTAAASAVYGAAAAMQRLGTGAIDSVSGVAQMQRVVDGLDTDAAQQQFRDLAREFNLPIATVSEAAFEAARVFKNQDDIFAATRTTLGAVRVAELSAGDAGRYLNAIYRGLGGTANDLQGTLDAANQITNRFGGTTQDLVAGTAGAAAAFRNAAKDGEGYKELLALIATGQAATGRSGQEIGTVVRRGATQVLRPEKRQTLLDLLGLDPRDASYTELIQRAQQIFADAATTAEQKSLIASTIFTPELASRGGQAILERGDLYRERLREAQPDRAAGSTGREVDRLLKSFREELAQIGVNLERLGSALAQSGALTTIGAMVQSLNAALNVATRIVETFALLPAPLRTSLVVLGQIVAARALLRRFDAGAPLVERFGVGQSLRRRPVPLERAEILQGIGYQRQWVEEETRSVGQRRQTAEFRRLRAQERLAQAVNEGAGEEEILRRRQQFLRFEREALDLAEDQADLAAQHRATLHQENEFKRRTVRSQRLSLEQQRAVAQELGIFYRNPTLEQRTTARPVPIGAPRDGGLGGAGGAASDLAFVGAAGRSTGAARAASRGAAQQGVLRAAVEEQRRSVTLFGRQNRAISTILGTASGAVVAAGRGIQGTAFGFTRLAASIGAALGPIELLILGAIGVATVYSEFVEASKKVDELRNLKALTPDQLDKRARKELKDSLPTQVVDAGFGLFSDIGRAVGVDLRTPNERRNDAAARALEESQRIRQLNRQGRLLTTRQIGQRYERRLRGADSAKEIDAAEQQALAELRGGRAVVLGRGPAALAAIRRSRQYIVRRAQEMRQVMGELRDAIPTDLTGLGTYAQVTLPSNIGLDGLRKGDIAGARRALRNARAIAKNATDPQERAQALAVIVAIEDAIIDGASRELDRMLRIIGKDPKRRSAAIGTFNRSLRRALPTGRSRERAEQEIAERGEREAQQAEQAANEALALRQAQRAAATAQFNRDHFANQAAILGRAVSDAQAAAADIRASSGTGADYYNALASVAQAQQAAAEYARQQAQELIRATGELRKARTDDPVRQAQIDLTTAKRLQRFATTEAERRQSRAEVINARKRVRDTALQSRVEDIDFRLEMERITREEAIRQLQSLTKTSGITKEARRDILRKIKALRDGGEEGELDLRVGDIKLPTAYEVRRALGEAQRGQAGPAVSAQQASYLRSSTVNNNMGGNTVNITVNDPQAAARVYEALDAYGMGPGRAADRAAGRR